MHYVVLCQLQTVSGICFLSDDAEMAMGFAVACPQNYTRKSAANYLSSLVRFAYDQQSGPARLRTSQKYLREVMSSLIKDFSCHLALRSKKKNKNLIQIYQHSDTDEFREVTVNFCRLLSDLCLISFHFTSSICEQENIIENFVEMMRNITEVDLCDIVDVYDLVVPVAKTMIQLIKAERQRTIQNSIKDTRW